MENPVVLRIFEGLGIQVSDKFFTVWGISQTWMGSPMDLHLLTMGDFDESNLYRFPKDILEPVYLSVEYKKSPSSYLIPTTTEIDPNLAWEYLEYKLKFSSNGNNLFDEKYLANLFSGLPIQSYIISIQKFPNIFVFPDPECPSYLWEESRFQSVIVSISKTAYIITFRYILDVNSNQRIYFTVSTLEGDRVIIPESIFTEDNFRESIVKYISNEIAFIS